MARWRRLTWLTAGLAILALMAASCSSGTSSDTPADTPDAAAEKVLRIAHPSTFVSALPAHTVAAPDGDVFTNIYDSLVRIKPGTTELEPFLATDWQVSDDGMVWTFNLREGVQWQHGYGEFTAHDVKFTWDYHLDPANGSDWTSDATIVKEVRVVDDYTVEFTLAEPFQGFIWRLANNQPYLGRIMSRAAFEDLGREGYEQTPVGTGAFMVEEVVPRERIVLRAFEDHWRGKPKVDVVEYVIMPDETVRSLAVESGDIDIALISDVNLLGRFESSPTVKVIREPAMEHAWWIFNTQVEPLNDVRVRKAIAYAIDYEGLVESILAGYGSVPTAGFLVPGQIGYDASVNPLLSYQPELARQLLEEAGYPDGFSTRVVTYDGSFYVQLGEFLTQSLSTVGIDLDFQALERATLTEVRLRDDNPGVILLRSDDPDPDFSLSLHVGLHDPPGHLNFARYRDMDDLYEAQRSTLDEEERAALLREIQRKHVEDVPAINLYIRDLTWLIGANVTGFQPYVTMGSGIDLHPVDR